MITTPTEKSQNHTAAGPYREFLRVALRLEDRATSPNETKKIPMSIVNEFMILTIEGLAFQLDPSRYSGVQPASKTLRIRVVRAAFLEGP